jgi:hypothetical protein
MNIWLDLTASFIVYQTTIDSIDRSRLTIGNQRCELPENDLYDFAYNQAYYNLKCRAGDEISEPGFYNASLAMEKSCDILTAPP